jgi:hypothetical protein
MIRSDILTIPPVMPGKGTLASMSAWSPMGHEERFPSPSLSGRCRLGEATFAGMGGKEEDAPKPAIPRGIHQAGEFEPQTAGWRVRIPGEVARESAMMSPRIPI